MNPPHRARPSESCAAAASCKEWRDSRQGGRRPHTLKRLKDSLGRIGRQLAPLMLIFLLLLAVLSGSGGRALGEETFGRRPHHLAARLLLLLSLLAVSRKGTGDEGGRRPRTFARRFIDSVVVRVNREGPRGPLRRREGRN